MNLDYKSTADLLCKHDNFLILTHSHPDGDTLGSAFALARALRVLGKKAIVECSDRIPDSYAFMWEGMDIQEFEPEFILAVDIADSVLLGEDFEAAYSDKINLNIDHHASNKLKADYHLIEGDSAATAEMVYFIILELGVDVDPQIADCIFTGVSTDTGCFRYSNTTARTHKIAAALIEAGANSHEINQIFFETKTKVYAALERLALDGMRMYLDERLAVMVVTQEMYKESGATDSESDRISALPRQIEGVKAGATLRETKGGNFKVSLRTNGPVNAADLAAKFDGGGHAKAAGFRLEGPLENALDKLLKVLSKEL
ncbi:MAG: bifunctional oligoribonuclease/PAP phosphatase NrnA [Clostridiales bacterium]|nr:bifunctional oligoribonuclease/PAP phosphatase NrnA [Clostridiales bacterium]